MEEGPHVKLEALDGLKGGKLGTVVQNGQIKGSP